MDVRVRRQPRRSPGQAAFASRFWPAVPALWLGLALALGLVVPASAAPEPLPACRYDDLAAAETDYGDWQTTLVDTIFAVPARYVPPDLTPVSAAGIAGSGAIRRLLIDDLGRLAADAETAGAKLEVESAYRSYDTQVSTFQRWVDEVGYDSALRVSARAGHSEHQLGTALDFKSAAGPPPWELSDWATTAAGSWMAGNAWRYGFVLSYPKGAFETVCYDYEPWHYRYFGSDLATKVHDSGQTPREYLWAVATGAASPSTSAAAPSVSLAAPASEAPGPTGTSATPSAAESAVPGSPGQATGGPGALVVPALAIIALGALALGLLASRRARRSRPPAHRVRTRR